MNQQQQETQTTFDKIPQHGVFKKAKDPKREDYYDEFVYRKVDGEAADRGSARSETGHAWLPEGGMPEMFQPNDPVIDLGTTVTRDEQPAGR